MVIDQPRGGVSGSSEQITTLCDGSISATARSSRCHKRRSVGARTAIRAASSWFRGAGESSRQAIANNSAVWNCSATLASMADSSPFSPTFSAASNCAARPVSEKWLWRVSRWRSRMCEACIKLSSDLGVK